MENIQVAGSLYSYGAFAPDTLTSAVRTSSTDSVTSLAASKIKPPQIAAFSVALTYRSARSSAWMRANLPPGVPGNQTWPSEADLKKGARSEAERPYRRAGRITNPLRILSLMMYLSSSGRHLRRWGGDVIGVVSVTTSVRLSPCTQVPEV